ncbi:MAG TPA: GNAT family N-acetyltransferase [Syntrophomonadaceae bacterium]|nr:GNAT family N-acetyltransferase [Syntrophomonadaceae bacterium]
MEYRVVKTLKEKEDVFRLRYRVFCLEKKWLNPEEYPDGKETDEYDQHSVHFLAQNDTGKIVGTARAIFPSELGLPVLNNFTDIAIPDHVERYVELSRLIVAKETRGLTATIGLLKSILNWCLDEGITTAFVIVEERMLNFLLRLGYPFQKAGQGKFYFGAYTIPAYVTLSELNKALQLLNIKKQKLFVEILIP